MGELAFLADEHVPRAYVHALRASGYTVERVASDHPEGLDDDSLLEIGRDRQLVLVTNDRDFVRLARGRPHAGIAMYTDQGLEPGEFVGAIRRIDAHFPPSTAAGEVFWLGQWTD